jgi:hypothetical protein
MSNPEPPHHGDARVRIVIPREALLERDTFWA